MMLDHAAACTEMERYLFDLNGYLVLEGALSADEVAEPATRCWTGCRTQKPGEWRGNVHGHNFTGGHEGLNLQQIYEAGPSFERLIDHPSWIAKVVAFHRHG